MMYGTNIEIIRNFVSNEDADKYFRVLLNEVPWSGTRKTATGQSIKIKRSMAYFSDDGKPYTYAGLELNGNVWNETLLEIKLRLEEKLPALFNSVLLNLYKDGRDEIRWHSDKEPQLGPYPYIPCLNLGASRKFWFMYKYPDAYGENHKFSHTLNNGDLLIMRDKCQEEFLHAVLKEKEVKEPRISLTFRKVYS